MEDSADSDTKKFMLKEIKKEIKFAKYSIKKNMDSSVELRSSFLINLFGMMLNNSAFLVVWVSFGTIANGMGDWRPIDAVGMIGIGTLGFGLCFAFFGGIRELPDIIGAGSFDKFLLSPKNVLVRLSTSYFNPSAVGDLIFGISCLIIWFYFNGATPLGIIFSIILCICSGLLYFFYSVFVNSAAFYFMDSREIVRGFFEFLITPSLFFGGAFQGLLRFTFIFIVPAMLIGSFPIEVIKQESFIRLGLVIFITICWAMLSVWVFNKSVKKYESTNFIGF